MGNFDAPALHEKTLDEAKAERQENYKVMARFSMALWLAVALVLFLPVCALFAAAAPTTLPQIALYQGADRDKILIEGAKKRDSLRSTIRTRGFARMSKISKRSTRSSRFPNGAATRKTCLAER